MAKPLRSSTQVKPDESGRVPAGSRSASMIARFFIDRPILANVLALLMLLLGAVSLINLPVAQYPQLTPPTITVTANYPGANARTVKDVVARAIEQQVRACIDDLFAHRARGMVRGARGKDARSRIEGAVEDAAIETH
jgi:hypothetical protein